MGSSDAARSFYLYSNIILVEVKVCIAWIVCNCDYFILIRICLQ